MKQFLLILGISGMLISCGNNHSGTKNNSKDLAQLLDNYWEERMQLFPLEATSNGDNRYNDKMTITIAQSFRDSLGRFYNKYLQQINGIDSVSLSVDEQMSYRLFKYEMQMGIEGLKYPSHYLPINQFWSLTLDLPTLGSGKGNQPFKTVDDYDNFLERLTVFPAWADTAIYNMRMGIKTGWVLPEKLVIKILPQLKAMLVHKTDSSIFYAPIKNFPDSIPADERKRLTIAYEKAITNIITPTYEKLYDFFEDEYLPKASKSSGIGTIPKGKAYYQYLIKYWTTTDLSPDSIYNIGQHEVERISTEMEKVKEQVGFKGDMKTFFTYLNEDKRFYPFTTPEQVIDSFKHIQQQEAPTLKKLFSKEPKTPFVIRQTEAFRAASASAEYNQASEDGSRPGVFYVPIMDAKKFNAVGMVTLFLHEAIPGHHYQISTQQENKNLPKFRRFLWYGAYGEGWALYSESLGNELGVYDNPYQYFGHLSDAMHRALRLVVDIGMHYKGMSREEAIQYMMTHERATEQEAIAEIERYMAIPGQALSYKLGQLTIRAERNKYEQKLGSKFNIASFHEEVLKDGCVPLNILRENMENWAKKQ